MSMVTLRRASPAGYRSWVMVCVCQGLRPLISRNDFPDTGPAGDGSRTSSL